MCSKRQLSVVAVCVVSLLLVGQLSSCADKLPPLPVRVDDRVELLSIVFRMIGADEYHMTDDSVPYVRDVDAWFAPYKDHQTLKLAARLREEHEIGFDAVAWFAVRLRGGARGEKLAAKIPWDDASLPMDSRWSPETASQFLAGLQKFADDTKAFEFFERHRALYAKAAARLSAEVNKRPYREWLGAFFGVKPGASFAAIVGMLNGGANYGMKVRYPDGHEEILPIIGAGSFDGDGVPTFGGGTTSLIAHEFCHSFANPLVDRHADRLLPAGETIFARRAERMKPQAYGSAKIMLYESLVRACTQRFLLAHGTPDEAAQQLRDEVARGFFWTPDLSRLLGEYEASRRQYATLDDFMPRIEDFFAELAGSIDQQMSRLPTVVRVVPANGAKDLAAGMTELRIEFDRPMDPTRAAICGRRDELPTFVPDGHFLVGNKVYIRSMTLDAGRDYTLSVNSIGCVPFESADGIPADPVIVRLSTSKLAPSATGSPP